MRFSKVTAVVLPLALLGCGGHSMPSGPTSSPSPAAVLFNVVPGSYGLKITLSSFGGEPVCSGGICASTSVCSGTQSSSAVTTFTTLVRLDRSGDAVTIRPEDPAATLRIDLRLDGSAAGGTVSGQFSDGAYQVAVTNAGGQPAVMTGTVLEAAVAGKISGQVATEGYGCTNNGHTWTLTPR
jgi:hypothetical protein